jgi:hypothetical protein
MQKLFLGHSPHLSCLSGLPKRPVSHTQLERVVEPVEAVLLRAGQDVHSNAPPPAKVPFTQEEQTEATVCPEPLE